MEQEIIEDLKEKEKLRRRAWLEANKEKIKEKRRLYREANKEKIAERCRIYQAENKEKIKQQKKEYYESTKEKNSKKLKEQRDLKKEKKREYDKKYREANKEKLKEKNRLYREANKDLIKTKKKQYIQDNKQKIREKIRKYDTARRHSDAKYRIDKAIACNIRMHLKMHSLTKNNRSWQEIVGYSLSDLMAHLESLFKEGMTWDNYGTYWHIDHIRPKSWFIYESVEDQAFKECWALSNLQPLEAAANISKGNRYEG